MSYDYLEYYHAGKINKIYFVAIYLKDCHILKLNYMSHNYQYDMIIMCKNAIITWPTPWDYPKRQLRVKTNAI